MIRDQPPVTRRCGCLRWPRRAAPVRWRTKTGPDASDRRDRASVLRQPPDPRCETRGHPNRTRVQRLMRHMGVAALYPKRCTSAPGRDHKVYPYLLTGVSVERANQVWATDICYLPMAKGFMYLVAVMDWLSRRVLSWRVSNTLDREFCVEALEEALARYGAPEIFNTDQGAQAGFKGSSTRPRWCESSSSLKASDEPRVFRGRRLSVAPRTVPIEVSPFGEVLAQQAVGVLVRAALPRTAGVAEEDVQPSVDAVERARPSPRLGPRSGTDEADQGASDRRCDRIPYGFGAMPRKRQTVLDPASTFGHAG